MQLEMANTVEEQINIARELMKMRPGIKVTLPPLQEQANAEE